MAATMTPKTHSDDGNVSDQPRTRAPRTMDNAARRLYDFSQWFAPGRLAQLVRAHA